jgi:hypothetical protein
LFFAFTIREPSVPNYGQPADDIDLVIGVAAFVYNLIATLCFCACTMTDESVMAQKRLFFSLFSFFFATCPSDVVGSSLLFPSSTPLCVAAD